MEQQSDREPWRPRGLPTSDYEPPRVERVLTPAELEGEILYAGAAPSLT